MREKKKPNRNNEQGFIYESRWTVGECVAMLQFGMILWLSLFIARCSIFTCFLCSILGTIVGCQLFLRKSYFYENQMVIVYPLRFYFRKVIIHYNEIACFVFRIVPYDGEYLFLIFKDSTFQPKIFKKRLSSSKVFPHKNGRIGFYFLLKHLKQSGCQIRTNKNYELENHIELVFGSGVSDYVRKSPAEKNKEHIKYRRIEIIINIVFLLVLILSYLYYRSLD